MTLRKCRANSAGIRSPATRPEVARPRRPVPVSRWSRDSGFRPAVARARGAIVPRRGPATLSTTHRTPARTAPTHGNSVGTGPMAIRLSDRDGDFEVRFAAFLTTKREVSEDVDQRVAGIIADVRARGDAALIEWTQRLDRFDAGARACASPTRRSTRPRRPSTRARWRRWNSPATASAATTPARNRPTTATPTRLASNSATAGRRSRRSASMCPAERRAIPLPC